MKLIKKVVKWSLMGGALGAAYGMGVMSKPKPKAPFYKRYSRGKK